MQRFFVAAHLTEAYLVQGLLRQAGISTQVFNEFSQGAIGELPPTAIHPEIWIEEERDRALARRVIEAYERQHLTNETTKCPSCGEENPAHFEVCWSCRTTF